MKPLEKLVSISSSAISDSSPDTTLGEQLGILGHQLDWLLRMRNGFYAFESALHVLPASADSPEIALQPWNSPQLWRDEYGDLGRSALFFGEDAFGNQFCANEGQVCFFEAETGGMTIIAEDLDGWAERILSDYEILTGYRLMHDWRKQNGPLPIGNRLMPKVPFVLGGAYSVDNLYALRCISAMKTRGNLARQLKELPDGTQVQFRVIP